MWNKHLTQIGGGEDKNQCDETRSNMHDKRSLRVYSFLDNKREIKPKTVVNKTNNKIVTEITIDKE